MLVRAVFPADVSDFGRVFQTTFRMEFYLFQEAIRSADLPP